MLVVESVQRETSDATGVHRSVDAADKQVYVWTSFEPDEARRAWACFDQPDLKAMHAFTVTAPDTWTVLSNTGDADVEDVDDGRRWTFGDTPRLSTYVPVVNAGPFHERRYRAGRPRPRPVLPAVARVVPRPGRRGALRHHVGGSGVLR